VSLLPPALRAGDLIAVVSTSWGGAGLLADRRERALAALGRLGYRVRLMPHALDVDEDREWLSAGRAERLADLHTAFADPEVRCVLSSIGGNHSAQLLEDLDFDLIARNPKVFCGYSDTTSLLLAVQAMTGLVTFYGPALLPEFGEVGGPDAEVVDQFQRVVGNPGPAGALPRVGWQTWEDRAATDAENRPRQRRAGEPRIVLRSGGAAGRLLVGCLPTVRTLTGTEWEPDWEGAILVVEAPEAPYDPEWADADLTHLRNAGVLSKLAALVIGRTDGWTERQREQLHKCVLDAARDTDYPILGGVECSHSAPLLTLPIGARAELHSEEIVIVEPAVVA
jgi:muramoyltetrapeptide carboxypeptidase